MFSFYCKVELFEEQTKMMIMNMQVMLNLLLSFFYFRNKNYAIPIVLVEIQMRYMLTHQKYS